PFLNLVLMHAAEGKQFLLVVDHFLPARAGERIVFHEENRLLRTDFLAEAAEDATEHVDFKLPGRLLYVARLGRTPGTGRRDADGLGGADELAQLAGNAFGAV